MCLCTPHKSKPLQKKAVNLKLGAMRRLSLYDYSLCTNISNVNV
jgi:hypothetical protein